MIEQEQVLMTHVQETRLKVILLLRALESHHRYGEATECRQMLHDLEHHPDILAMMHEHGLEWEAVR